MIEVFLYSIANGKPHTAINDMIQEFINSDFVPQQEKKILRHTLKVAENGGYPTMDYYAQFFPMPEMLLKKSIAEIRTYVNQTLDFYHKQFVEQGLIKAMNEADTTQELITRVQSITDENLVVDDSALDDVGPKTYGDSDRKLKKGLYSGVKELDDVTFGFQEGAVASICGFTGHGKSTFVDSILFKNALEGKKNMLLSLEMAPEIIWAQIEARYMYQVKGIQVTAQDIQFRKMPSDIEEKVLAAEDDFKEEIGKNLMILDESYIDKNMMCDYKMFSAFIRKCVMRLGGLDVIAFDHVGQFELMFPECGNRIIKSIQSFTKTFVDGRGIKPVSILAVQTNRQGEARARKRGGVYDIQAISDLNEVERTSTYIVFMYTSDDMKIMQETKITMAKHRLGSVIPEPISTTFNPAVVTVGAAVESVTVSDDDFNSMDLDLGVGGFDDF